MDPSTYQQMMAQALMAGVYQPGLSPAYTAANPTTPWGQAAITGNPTAPGGMLANAPGTLNPNTMQGAQALNMAQQPPQQMLGMGQS